MSDPRFDSMLFQAERAKLRALEDGFWDTEEDAQRRELAEEAARDRGCDDGDDDL